MSRRLERIEILLKKELYDIVQNEIRDKKISNRIITITGLRISPDLKNVKIHISSLGGEEINQDIVDRLNNANSYIKRIIAERKILRVVPSFHFYPDNSIEVGNKIDDIIEQISEVDTGEQELGKDNTDTKPNREQ